MKNNIQLSKRIYSKKMITKLESKIRLLGKGTKINVYKFQNTRILTSFILFFVILYTVNFGYIVSPAVTIIYYFMYEKILLNDKIKLRKQKLESEAMNFFEVLTLSLETGRNLEEAIRVTINSINNELSKEFELALRQLEFGKSLTEALNDMQKNIPSDNINNIILSLTQASTFGNSVIETLYNQIDYLREKRKLELKADISKIPIKISVISVLFFVPLILLIILAPVLLTYIG